MGSAIGGNKKRPNNGPAQARYNNERRWEKNKAKRIAKQAKFTAKQQLRRKARDEKKQKDLAETKEKAIKGAGLEKVEHETEENQEASDYIQSVHPIMGG